MPRAEASRHSARVGAALAIALACALLSGSSLLASGIHPAHDNLLNVHRVVLMERCLADGQIPCRWVPAMGLGRGYPLFNYYPPLPSYVGAGLTALGVAPADAVKALFLLALAVGALGMFGLALPFVGPSGALLASVFYTWAPYRATDVFVRGALGETCGLAILPFLFWTGYRLLGAGRVAPGSLGARRLAPGSLGAGRLAPGSLGAGRFAPGLLGWVGACALAWAALLCTHALVAMMVAPFYALWCVLFLGEARSPATLAGFALAHLLALGLAAFYWVPAVFELGYVHSETLVSLYPWNRFENNFLTLAELLQARPAWGFAPFRAEHNGMALLLGPLHVGATLLALGWIALRRLRGRPRDAAERTVIVLALAGAVAAWLTLASSRPLWERVAPLAYLQFPWRFLGVAAFGFSFAAGFLARARLRHGPLLAVLGALATIGVGWSWFQPSGMHPLRAELTTDLAIARVRHGLFDYMPRAVDLALVPNQPLERLPPAAELLDGRDARLDALRAGSDWVTAEVVAPGGPVQLRINRTRFPGWTVWIDGEPAALAEVSDPAGRLHVALPAGHHRIRAELRDTPLRAWSNRTSTLALALGVAICAVAAWQRRRSGPAG